MCIHKMYCCVYAISKIFVCVFALGLFDITQSDIYHAVFELVEKLAIIERVKRCTAHTVNTEKVCWETILGVETIHFR